MIVHPCIDGLSPSCYKAYPYWITRALAYKLLYAILPKEILPMLKADLDLPFIGPDATLPAGVDLPPGSIIPPNLPVPENWIPWFHFIFTGFEDPRTLFPKDWKPRDPLPQGVKVPPDYEIPSGWTPEDPPHPVFLPGYNPYPTPPTTGAAPPIYVQPYEPGPVHTPTPTPPSPWTQILTDAYWEAPAYGIPPQWTMTWDGEKWLVVIGGSTECFNWPQLNPKTGTTWSVGYRPTKARVTFTGGTSPIKIGFCAVGSITLGHNLNCVSPQEIDLDFSADLDIYMLDTTNIGMYVTNIEFYEG